MRRFLAIIVLGGLAAYLTEQANGAPEPSLAPQAWELDFAFHDLARITVSLPGEGRDRTYWYMLYTVTNNTGQEVGYYPTFTLVTDTLKVVEGGIGVPPHAIEAIRNRHAKQYPFFVAPSRVFGPLRQGIDNQLTSAVVFRDFDPQASGFGIYVGGLSGEIVRLSNPTYDPQKRESDNNPRSFVLRKTLAIEYDLPGDARTRDRSVPTRVSREWVMR